MKCSAVALLALSLCASFAEAGKKCKAPKEDKCDGPSTTIKYPYDKWLPDDTILTNGEPLPPPLRNQIPSLSQPFYNNVIDVRAQVSAKDTALIVSTAGVWQFALTELLHEKYFEENPDVKESYLITTSPPISVPQLNKGQVKVGNIIFKDAQPHVAIGPQMLMNGLTNQGKIPAGFTPFEFFVSPGNVILKLVGEKRIKSFPDLSKIKPGRFASATFGAVGNYRASVAGIFPNFPVDKYCNDVHTGADLVNLLFGSVENNENVAGIGYPMHQSIPHVLVTGQADAGLMFLPLAVGIMRNNPGVFEAIYLGTPLAPPGVVKKGATTDPEVLKLGQDPLPGNVQVTISATITTTPVDATQIAARDNFIAALKSSDLTTILANNGLLRPPGFIEE